MTSVLDHSVSTTPSVRPRLGAASAATLALLTAAGLLLDQSGTAHAATAIGLGTADSFAVLAGDGITNTNATTITGDIGTFPTTTVTGDNAGADDITLNGTHVSDTVADSAHGGLLAAYNNAFGQPSDRTITGELANPAATLSPGVYSSGSTMGLTGALTLDGGGNADAVFIFQIGSSLTVNPGGTVLLIGGAQACNVWWQIGESATLDTDAVFVGNILAEDDITLNSRASIVGRALTSNGAVTMDNNVITRPGCTGPTPSSTATSGSGGSGTGSASQVPRVPVGSVDAGDGSSLLGRTPDAGE